MSPRLPSISTSISTFTSTVTSTSTSTVTLAVLLLGTVLSGQAAGGQDQQQRQLGPRSFFPKEYVCEGYVNLKALQDTDLWDHVERNYIARAGMAAFRTEYGFRFGDLIEIRSALRPRKIKTQGHEHYHTEFVTVFQGRRKLELPQKRKQEWDWNRRVRQKIAGYDVVREGPPEDSETAWRQPMLYVAPQPNCVVFGDKRLVEPVLTGGRRGGVPHPELMAFTAGKRPMAYMVQKLEYDKELLAHMGPFPAEWYVEADAPRFMMFWFDVDVDTQKSKVAMSIRFTSGKSGPAHFEGKLKESFKRLDTDPVLKRIKALKTLVKRLEFKTSDTDLEIRCDLGDAAEAAQFTVIGQALPFLLYSAARTEVVATDFVEHEHDHDHEEEEKPKPKEGKDKAKPRPKDKGKD